MKKMRTSMDEVWHPTQLFLSDTGVHKVDINTLSSKLRCDCEGFFVRTSCKHIRYVKRRMEDNNGVYPTEISTRATRLEALEAADNPETFRKLLITYGKIEVL